MRGDRQNHMHSARSPWLRAGLSITYSFMNGEILEIKKSFEKSNGEILEIKKSFEKSNGEILEIKKSFEKSKNHSRNQTEKFGKSKNHSRNQTDKTRIKTYNYFSDTPRTPYKFLKRAKKQG